MEEQQAQIAQSYSSEAVEANVNALWDGEKPIVTIIIVRCFQG